MSLQPVELPESREELTLLELDRRSQLIVCTLRALAVGRGDCPLLQRQLEACCGPRCGEAFAALFVLVKQLGWRSRRRLGLLLPGSRTLSADELGLLAAVAAAEGRCEDVAARLHDLLGGPPEPLMTEAVMLIANATGGAHRAVH